VAADDAGGEAVAPEEIGELVGEGLKGGGGEDVAGARALSGVEAAEEDDADLVAVGRGVGAHGENGVPGGVGGGGGLELAGLEDGAILTHGWKREGRIMRSG